MRVELSEEERAEVKALIDAGQPLPNRYRFRLFAEPREAELIWPGKTSEVTNVVLPFQSIGLGLPDLAQLSGWSRADAGKEPHDETRALFGGCRIGEMEDKLGK